MSIMEQQRASQTAIRVAVQRAAHQVLDGEPKILNDRICVGLFPEASEAVLRDSAQHYHQPSMRRSRANYVLRSRFAEDRLEDAAKRGVSQFLLLGAGLDTFAYRQPKWAQSLRIIEVDHPASQTYKIAMLRRARATVPENVSFFPIDFENENATSSLASVPLDKNKRLFVSWLGVTQYAERKALLETLRLIAGWSSGSEIVLTYIKDDWSDLDDDARKSMVDSESFAKASKEPWVSKLSTASMADLLSSAGFSQSQELGIDQAKQLYFGNRTDGLTPAGGNGIVWAR